ncbi:hypothetical protein BDC45DRAFT_537954 [Circinella umbellata]|nr:hypothetical protein BDC45DRAFT_537954 [Circinella umbellata]
MFSHLISSPHTLDIELLEPVIYLHGRRSDAVIRGSIGVTVHKPHTLKSLVLLFEGRSRIKHGDYKVSRKRIARHQLTIYPTTTTTSNTSSSQRPFLLQTGKSRFGFEMRLPPGLAGTLHCKEIKVDYKLMASIQYLRHPSSPAIVKRDISKPIYLVRSPISSTMSALVNGENVDACVDSQKQHSRWCQYHITIDQQSVVLGQVLPITLSIAPHLDGLCLEHVYTQIIERRHIRGKKYHGDLNEEEDEEWETYKSTHMLLPTACNQQQQEQIDDEGYSPGKSIPIREPWQDTLRYHVSSVMENGLVRTSKKESPDYYIDHTVNVSFVISFPVLGRQGETRRYTKTLMFQADIELLDPNMCSTPPVSSSSTASSTLSSPSPSFLSLNELWMKGGTSNEHQQQQQQQSSNSSNMQVLPPYEEHGSCSPRMTSSRLPSLLLSSHNNGYLTTVNTPSSSTPSSPSSSTSSTPRLGCSPPKYDQIFAL